MAALAVIIPAAGSGTRLGSRIPKPFIPLNGKAILEHTIAQFLPVKGLSQIIVATSKSSFEDVENIFANFGGTQVDLTLVEGGAERQHSIENALKYLKPEIELVAIHDAVRPFISKAEIEKCVQAASEFGGAILAVPAKDTIKKVDSSGIISETPVRANLWQAQTPQIFKKDLLLNAYKKAREDNYLGTDDASLIEYIGGAVKIIEGDRKNLKITYPLDLIIAEHIVQDKS